uniref:G_PROTEIN_RECEP_F1_2 domain-containing protein n=1 Tax=Steinernema glaseri TaxID=37863 RepID=A0A1I7YTU5_9BILA
MTKASSTAAVPLQIVPENMFGKHLYVPDWLLDSFSYYDYLSQYPMILINLFIILLSYNVKSSLCRTYALNIAIPTLITGIYNIVRHFLNDYFMEHSDDATLCRTYALNIAIPTLITGIYNIVRHFLNDYFMEHSDDAVLQQLDIALSCLTTTNSLNLYEVQGTFMTMLTYFGCVRPILYKKLFNESNIRLGFFLGHILALLLSAESFFERAYPMLLYGRFFLRIHTVVVVVVKCTVFLAMLAFYVSTLVKLKNYPITRNMDVQKSRLRAVAIYCTPPNVFLLLTLIGTLCSARITFKLNSDGTSDYTSCTPLLAIVYNLVTVRLIVNSVCVLVAFADYRRKVVAVVVEAKNRMLCRKNTRIFSSRQDSTRSY